MTEESKKTSTALQNDKTEKQHDRTSGKYDGDDWKNRPRSNKEKFSAKLTAFKLQIPERKGFRRHWVIEREIPEFLAREWEPVKGSDGQQVREVMNTGKYNKDIKEPEYGILMEIPEIYFQENLKSDDDDRKALMDRRTPSQNQAANVDGAAYTQPVGIENKIERNKPITG